MNYFETALAAAKQIRATGSSLLLAVETSCDETAAAVLDGMNVLSGSVYSQIPLHKKYGGVVPEIASRSHVTALDNVVTDALGKAGKTLDDIEAVAVTQGPGLVGALLCGLNYAKALAFSRCLPLIGVHHIEGHICANYLAHPDLRPPFVCLVASGGHSHLVRVLDYGEYRLLGKTLDDAAGEAFDKAARVLNLPYPGGPELDRLAASGDPDAFSLPKPRIEGYDFSFSGLKTAFAQACVRADKEGRLYPPDAAAAFQSRVVDQMVNKAVNAAISNHVDVLALAGGVAANSALRKEMAKACADAGLRFCVPPISLCTDNAEMIGAAGQLSLMRRPIAGLTINAKPSMPLFKA